jgi:predicted O-methyltransferase YrrM
VVSKSLVEERFPNADVEVIESDSVAFLKSFEEPIDVLYLDSDNDANLILEEAKAALCNLHPESIILIDDCFNKGSYDVEKGELVIPFLESEGWIMELSEYQALFIHKDRF